MDGEFFIPFSFLNTLFSQLTPSTLGSFRKHRCFERLFSLLPPIERAGFRTGRSDRPVVVEEEQDANREERAAGRAGGTYQGGGEEPAAGPGGLGSGPQSCRP